MNITINEKSVTIFDSTYPAGSIVYSVSGNNIEFIHNYTLDSLTGGYVPFTNVINEATGLAFANAAALKTFLKGSFKTANGAGDAVSQEDFAETGSWLPYGNSATFTINGMPPGTFGGTPTIRNISTANSYKSFKRIAIVGAAVAQSAARAYTPLVFFRGETFGGFDISIFFGVGLVGTDAPLASGRIFAGLHSGTSGIGGAVEPSTLFNTIGVGSDSTDANLQILHNDSSGAATKINLGSGFSALSVETDRYKLRIKAIAGDTKVTYTVTNLTTGAVATGELSSNIPTATELLGVHLFRSNNTSALAAVFDVFKIVTKSQVYN